MQEPGRKGIQMTHTKTMQTARQITKQISRISSIILVAIFAILFAIGVLAKLNMLP